MPASMGGKPGNVPKPVEARSSRGRQPSRVNDRAVEATDRPLRQPAWLSDAAKRVWQRCVRELKEMGIAHAADQDVLTSYCCAVIYKRRAAELLDRSNVLSTRRRDGQTVVVANPAGREFDRYVKLERALAQEFGFTPSARTRIDRAYDEAFDDAPDSVSDELDEELAELVEAARRDMRGE